MPVRGLLRSRGLSLLGRAGLQVQVLGPPDRTPGSGGPVQHARGVERGGESRGVKSLGWGVKSLVFNAELIVLSILNISEVWKEEVCSGM